MQNGKKVIQNVYGLSLFIYLFQLLILLIVNPIVVFEAQHFFIHSISAFFWFNCFKKKISSVAKFEMVFSSSHQRVTNERKQNVKKKFILKTHSDPEQKRKRDTIIIII